MANILFLIPNGSNEMEKTMDMLFLEILSVLRSWLRLAFPHLILTSTKCREGLKVTRDRTKKRQKIENYFL